MKKLVFLLFFPLCSWGIVLPSHYGSEIGAVVEGNVQKKKPYLTATKFYVEVLNSRLIKDRLIITILTALGKKSEDYGVGASGFIKIHKNFYIGARMLADYNLDFKHHLTLMPSFKIDKHTLDFYVTADIIHHGASEFGLRFYYEDMFSVMLGLQSENIIKSINKLSYVAKFSTPLHGFKFIDNIWNSIAGSEEDLSKEIKEVIEEVKK